MKIRQGFVSNSSSSSFIVVGQPPAGITAIQLTAGQKFKICNDMAHWLTKDYLDKDLWLTGFLSDAGHYTDPLDEDDMEYYSYCTGGHGGPYSEEDFINIGSSEPYEGVWLLPEHRAARPLPPKGHQIEFEFEDDNEQ